MTPLFACRKALTLESVLAAMSLKVFAAFWTTPVIAVKDAVAIIFALLKPWPSVPVTLVNVPSAVVGALNCWPARIAAFF